MNSTNFRKITLLGLCVLLRLNAHSVYLKSDNSDNSFSGTIKSSNAALASTIIYIDPSANSNGTGTEASPWNGSSLINDPWQANTTYLFKRGTTYSHSNKINVQVAGVTLGAYGTGAAPILQQTANNDNINGSGSITIQDLELLAPLGTAGQDANQMAFWPGTGYLTVSNCKIHGGFQGVRVMESPTLDVKITNCQIYDTWSDGLFITTAHSLEVGYCTVYNVNTSHPNYPDDGDNIHTDDINTIYIHHNTLDHTTQPGKFCLLLGSGIVGFTTNATIEYNTMTRTRTGDDNTVFYSNYAHGSNIIFRYNIVKDALMGIQSRTYDMQIYYNTFSNVGVFMELSAPNDYSSNVKVWNNSIYNCGLILNGYGEIVDFRNNIVHTVTGAAFSGGSNITLDYNDYYNIPTFGNISKGAHDLASDPLFNNITNLDFTLKNGSPCIDKGTNVLNTTTDIVGDVVPAGNSVDIGSHEYGSTTGVPTNKPPVVSLTSPSSGSSFTAPAIITITATASDPDGSISKVEFYSGTSLIGQSTTSPYSFSWTNVVAGTYRITAVATDNLNSQTTSSAVTVTVKGQATSNLPPVINITSPANGANFTAPANFSITVNASDPDGTISKVEFYNGTTKLGQSTVSPYTYTWSNVAVGAYSIIAVATDNLNSQTTSSVVTVWVNSASLGNKPPAISVTAPTNGQTFTAPATITISATASDPDGKISRVEFYNGTTKLGQSTTTPYSFSWTNVAAGTYKISAVATDNLYSQTTSAAITVTVNSTSSAVNKPPVINITSPANGANLSASAALSITASASDPDGKINKVQFYNGTTKLGETTAAPYSISVKNIAAGTYNLIAVAFDNLNVQTLSKVVTVLVKTTSDVPNPTDQESFKIYPNPNDGRFSISIPDTDTIAEVIIVNLSGKIVYSYSKLNKATPTDFDLSNSPPGVYILTIKSNKRLVSKKFVKI
jgi:hypothetical protein